MAVPDITLGYGEVLVTETESQLGLFAYDPKTTKFGYVEKVNALTDRTFVGDQIIFDPQQARDYVYGSTRYFIVKEKGISGKEPIAP